MGKDGEGRAAAEGDMAVQLRRMLWLFAPILFAINLVMPTFHFGDDIDHVRKAYTVAHLEFPAGARPSGAFVPGHVDAGLERVIERDASRLLAYRRDLPPVWMAQTKRETPWEGLMLSGPVAGSIHLPLVYAPQALGLRIGELTGLSIENSLLLSRLFNGFAALGVIALAFRALPTGVMGAVLVLLALPKTLFAFASNALDPLLLAGALAVLAMTYQALKAERTGPLRWLGMAAVIVAIAGARPPLLAIALIPGALALMRRDRAGLAAIAVAIAISVAWSVLIAPGIQDPRCGTPAPLVEKMTHVLVSGPAMVWRALLRDGGYYYYTLVGEIGWGRAAERLFTPLSPFVYATTIPVLGLASLFVLATPAKLPRLIRLTSLAAAVVYLAGVFFAEAVGCTGLNTDTITGVQGRYFLPALLMLALAGAGSMSPSRFLPGAFKAVFVGYLMFSVTVAISSGLYFYWAR
ncbi:MAG TPA: DUF2142 domain-containing protein [Caulobacteraceae bacterium]|nr:DUF2142 domain-containing protein [Caulobacteraceae bacterium]